MFSRLLGGLGMIVAASGCTTLKPQVAEDPGISNQVRNEIHRLAVRDPNAPQVALADQLESRGAATGKSALGAGLLWLGGTFEAASEAGAAGPFVAALGVLTTPFAMVGGALYGAVTSDTQHGIETGNQILTRVLDFAPDRFRHALEQRFQAGVPVDYAFVRGMTDAELAAAGFDAVLDVRMNSLTSSPSEEGTRVYFEHASRAELRILGQPDLTRSRFYSGRLGPRTVSDWAGQQGQQLLTALDAEYEAVAGNIVDDFLVRKSIRVQGLEPVSTGWAAGTISGTMPLFVWSARDGASAEPGADVTYEIRIYQGSQVPESGVSSTTTRYVPAEPLQACRRYRWQVRAHYVTFGEPVASDWTPVYRFKTPCAR